MAGKKIVFQRLQLQGFGPYREAVDIYFQPGINNLVAENEKGKSTMAAGLTAVIFGLPAVSDPAKFGLACYRNWQNPAACTGELEFTVNKERFSIERDFDTNRVCFAKLGAGGEMQTVLAEGTHNPNAKRPHPAYENKLKETFGLFSRELFVNTFYLTQPLPELKSLSREVQKLLSGGGVDFGRALKALEKELKEWTKYTADLGVTSRNLQKDRELELITRKITGLQERLDKDRQAVDSLEEVQEKLQKIEEQCAAAQQDWRHKRRVQEAWSEWKRLQESYQSALRDYRQLLRADEEAAMVQQEGTALLQLLDEKYPELKEAGEETGRLLEELLILEEKKRGFQENFRKLQHFLEVKEAEKTRLEKRLTEFPRWEELGADPAGQVQVMQKNAAACLQEWSVFQGNLKKIADKESVLATRYGLFQQAGPAEQEALASYTQIDSRLKRAQQVAAEDLEKARVGQDGYTRALHAFKEKFQDLEQEIANEAAAEQKIAAAEQKLIARERESVLEKRVEQLEKKLIPSISLRLCCTFGFATVAGVAAAVIFTDPLLRVVVALVGGLAGFLGARPLSVFLNANTKKELRKTAGELAGCRQELARLDAVLGSFSMAGPAQLGALTEKIKQYREEKAGLEALKGQLPGIAAQKRLETGFQQATLEYQRFLEMTEKFVAVFPDLEAAFGQWKQLSEEKKRIRQETNRYAWENFSCSAQQVSEADPRGEGLAERWQETAYFLKIFFPAGEYTTVYELLNVLEKADLPAWEELKMKAQEYAALVNGILKLGTELETATLQKNEQEKRLSGLQEKFDESAAGIQPILAGAGGNLQKVRERWAARQSVQRKLDLKNAALQAILKQYQVASLEKLNDKKSEAELQAREYFARWEKHIEKYPGLPKVEEKENVGKIIKSMDDLAREVEVLEKRSAEFQKKREAIRAQQLQLQGRDLVNIAQVETELAALRKNKEAVQLLSEALAVAHKELTAAIAGYQSSYLQYLEEQATKYYREITRNKARRITLDEKFYLQVQEGGRPCEITQLSKGAQDQLYLALRFAVADLLAENFKLPFIFDDPFVSSDDGRLENIQEILDRASRERQFAILSHNEVFSGWGAPVELVFNNSAAKKLRCQA